jgi:hypothetical protein
MTRFKLWLETISGCGDDRRRRVKKGRAPSAAKTEHGPAGGFSPLEKPPRPLLGAFHQLSKSFRPRNCFRERGSNLVRPGKRLFGCGNTHLLAAKDFLVRGKDFLNEVFDFSPALKVSRRILLRSHSFPQGYSWHNRSECRGKKSIGSAKNFLGRAIDFLRRQKVYWWRRKTFWEESFGKIMIWD